MEQTPAQKLVRQLTDAKQTISSCESFTAGLFSSTVASIPGASVVLKGGLVTYWAQIKESVAHVPADLIETYGVVSEQCAVSMAENTRKIMDTDWCVSFTGNAGPSALEGKPAGLIYYAIAGPDGTEFFCEQKDLERNELRQWAVSQAMCRLSDLLSEK